MSAPLLLFPGAGSSADHPSLVAIEAAVDRISLDKHQLSKRAKDIGSAAVFVALVNVVVVWVCVLLEN